ncbi:MAG: ABC transporter ATP-binding protein [Lentisphaeria bacterium]|nr:ABC transporter ATP-binding protein [Lentisphaeria bacterium]
MSFAVEIKNLCFGYEEHEVLHNINLEISQRDFAIIVGPNGGGKTTLLRLMLGLLEPRYGSVKIFGKAPSDWRRKMAYVPQSLSFDPRFPISVMETVLLGRIERHLFGGARAEDRRIAEEALQEVGLADTAKKPFAALSGGQRQRVLIAQALASQPELLLLDEPGANLDTPGVTAIYGLLKELSHRLTIVMVSHNLTMVEPFATHVICVNHTADMHKIQEVSREDLHAGNWIHIFHHECPVAHETDDDPCCGPHLGQEAHK